MAAAEFEPDTPPESARGPVGEEPSAPLLDQLIDHFASLEESDLASELRGLDRELRRLEATLAVGLHVAHGRRLGRHDGYVSMTAWQRGELLASPTQTRHRTRLSGTVSRAPEVVDALLSGRLGVTQAQQLAAAATHERTARAFTAASEDLLDAAIREPHREFQTRLQQFQMAADPKGAIRRAEAVHRRRWLAMGITDDIGFLHGNGGVLDTTEMREILDRFTQIEFAKDWEACTAQHGDKANVGLMARTTRQRRWDALHQIFLQAAATPTGAQLPVPTLNIVMDLATYESALTRMRLIPGLTHSSLLHIDTPTMRTRRCQTSTGVAVEPVEAVARTLHGHIRRVVFDSPSLVTDLGRRQRLFTGAAREAVELQSTHCIWPGCTVPSAHCQHDHLHNWSEGGGTSPANGAPLCGRHNRHKSKGYTVGRRPGGDWKVTRPDGSLVGV